MTREEEAKIIRAVVDGNTNAFEDLVLEYQKQVYHITLNYRMAANLCIDFLRKKKRQGGGQLISLDEEEEDRRPRELPDLRYEPQGALEKKEMRQKVQEGLQRLPHEQRLILVMRDVEGFSYQEISDTLKIELGTVKSRIYRARAHLARLLTEDGNFLKDPSSEGMERR